MSEASSYELGQVWVTSAHRVSRDEMVSFASQWDPLPIHLKSPSADSPFSDVIASGLLSLAVFQRLVALQVYQDLPIVAARGLQSVRFMQPVYPGNELTARVEIISVGAVTRGRRDLELAGSLLCNGSAVMSVTIDLVLQDTIQTV